jgi:hypothetical protein
MEVEELGVSITLAQPTHDGALPSNRALKRRKTQETNFK